MKIDRDLDFLRECLLCDPLAGTLHWIKRPREHFNTDRSFAAWNARFSGKEAGNIDVTGYRRIKIYIDGKSRQFLTHRVIWAMTTGEWPVNEIDHINGVKSENRMDNMRDVKHQDNSRNSGMRRKNRAGLKGVHAQGKTFIAQIKFGSKGTFLGRFATAEAAHEAYKLAAIQHHGAFARW